jgi:hypothetical protein
LLLAKSISAPGACGKTKLEYLLTSMMSKLSGMAKDLLLKSFSHLLLWSSWLINSGFFPCKIQIIKSEHDLKKKVFVCITCGVAIATLNAE